jgi:hypothetical protein
MYDLSGELRYWSLSGGCKSYGKPVGNLTSSTQVLCGEIQSQEAMQGGS